MQGDYLWNAGIFLAQGSSFIQALELHAADILSCCRDALKAAKSEITFYGYQFVRPQPEAFNACRAESVDYAVMEKHSMVGVVQFPGQWSDVGSCNSLSELTPPDPQGNRIEGNGLTLNTQDTFIYAQTRPVVDGVYEYDLFVHDC